MNKITGTIVEFDSREAHRNDRSLGRQKHIIERGRADSIAVPRVYESWELSTVIGGASKGLAVRKVIAFTKGRACLEVIESESGKGLAKPSFPNFALRGDSPKGW
jgi:hypothetical protein